MLRLAGLLLTGLDDFEGPTAGTVLVVGLAMTGSVTFLPAITARSGDVLVARVPLAHFGNGPDAARSLVELRRRSDTASGGGGRDGAAPRLGGGGRRATRAPPG
ncbi:hypothetical protein DZF91_08635, partial [Actinomadura logoneensis]